MDGLTAEYFVLTLPLKTEKWQEDQLNKRMEVNRQIYNALLGKALKRYRQMCQTRKYRELELELANETDKAVRKQIYKQLDGMREQYRLRRFDLTKDAAQYRKYFKENTDSPIVQNIAVSVHKALDKLMSREAQKVHFKKEGEMYSVSGKTNISSIMYKEGIVHWKKLKLPAVMKHNDYEREALKSEIRYCRIKRQMIRGKWKYYVDLILKGKCPVKQSQVQTAHGTVGIDMGMTKLAVAAEDKLAILPMPAQIRSWEYQKQRLMKSMERSRRILNPDNYNPDGTIMKKKQHWNESGHYKKSRQQYREICRRQKIRRLEMQQKLVQELMKFGNEFYVENFDYDKMRRKSKIKLYRKNGGYKRKQRYGKAIEASAPASFLNTLERKITQQGGSLYRVDPVTAKAASLNHATKKTENISLRRKWRRIQGYQINKYLYSAFLIQHIDKETESVDTEMCSRDFKHFIEIYEQYQLEKELEQAS